ncbi:19460_t:CDS:2 [Gigaspora rosea]|nr:19460_t:CDS:2 [Gigaspora rosea]
MKLCKKYLEQYPESASVENSQTRHDSSTNGTVSLDIPASNTIHKEESLLISPFNEMPILREYLSFISNVIAYNPEKSLLMLINGKEWRSNILMKFLHHPNLALSKHRPGALYDAFTIANVLGPEHILVLARALY